MKRTKFNFLAVASVCTAMAFSSCDSNDDVEEPQNSTSKGTVNVAATDAAVDAENVTGVFLNVKGIEVDGDDDANDATVMFDATQEFNLMAYQNGRTYDMGNLELNAGTYSDITFILDEDQPAYVQFTDNTTSNVDLESNTTEYEIIGDFEVMAESQTDLVADVDLRKAFVETSTEGEFMLRSTARLVKANISGTITGTVENYEEMKSQMETAGVETKLVVYAYADGMFNEAEKEDQDGSGLEGRFENSINSAVVADDGTFTLAFMEEADYEMVVGVFEKGALESEEEEYEFTSLIQTELAVGGSLDVVLDILGVEANSNTDISIRLDLGS